MRFPRQHTPRLCDTASLSRRASAHLSGVSGGSGGRVKGFGRYVKKLCWGEARFVTQLATAEHDSWQLSTKFRSCSAICLKLRLGW